jgi:myo-inositol 2-dehydrogenase / D-chiro-inositol 1-dehydrogenase
VLRLGLAGLGIHGLRYANHLLAGDVPGGCLAAVSRADADAGRDFAARHGVAFVPDPRELAAFPGLDAVIVVLRPDLHAPVAEACLEAGRPVLVEKPLATCVADARRIARLAERARAPLMVAHTLRFDAVVERMREALASLGPLRLMAINQRFDPAGRGWLDEPGPGGVLLNTAVHGLDLIRFLTGREVESVTAEVGRAETVRTEDQAAAVLRLEGGVLATLDNCRATAGRSGRIEIAGDRGQLVGDHVHRTLVRYEGRRAENLGPVPQRPTVPEVLRRFVACVAEGAPVPVTARDGLAAVELAEAMRISAAEGRRVRVADLRF